MIAPGDVFGAKYSPAEVVAVQGFPTAFEGQIYPSVASPPGFWFTIQTTPVSLVPVTMSVNWKVSPGPISAVVGSTCTRMPESRVIENVPNAFDLTQLLATIKIEAGLGTVAGGV